MHVSAVIPAHNACAFVRETLESLLNQSKVFSEIIVVDDGSTDNTSSIVAAVAGMTMVPVRLYSLQQNQGVSAARNKGLEIAREEWVMFFDADDLAEPALLESLCEGVSRLNAIDPGRWVLGHTAYIQVNEQGERLPGVHRSKQVEPEEILGYEFVRNSVISSGALVNKQKALQAGGFDTDLKYSEDWDFWLRLAGIGGFVYIDVPLVRVRRHPGNASVRINSMLNGEDEVLKNYDLSFIERAVYQRKLSWEQNTSDFISLLYRLNSWEIGFEKARLLVATSISYPAGFFLLGLYYAKTQQWKDARRAFESTLTLLPSHGAALNNLGAVRIIEGDAETATVLLEKALAYYPGYIDAQRNLMLIQGSSTFSSREVRLTWRELRPVLTVYGD